MKTLRLSLFICLILALTLALTACNVAEIVDKVKETIGITTDEENKGDGDTENENQGNGGSEDENQKDEDPYGCITVKEALELCGEEGNITEERYYIRAIITEIKNAAYGEMVIADETGSIYVYGTYSKDGSIQYPDFEEKPVKGDEVVLHCILQNYNGTKEVKNARLIEFTKGESTFNEADYTEMTVSEAREAEVGRKVKVSGTVARITFANGKVPNGFILVDGTSSIYVFDSDLAQRLSIGNKITVLAEKTYWVLETEKNNADKFGYKGACQLTDAHLLTNDEGKSDFDKSWIETSTIKKILDTPVSENITSKIYKVTSLVEKREGNGFTNYYFHDLDGVTSTYTYTQCNGSDFTWLNEFDGKICTVYITALNAKSTSSDCYFRFLPITVVNENFAFDLNETPKFVFDYFASTQFDAFYTGDPALELIGTASSELLGFENATVSYTSSNIATVSFQEEDGKTVMHCNAPGKATVSITVAYNNLTYTGTVEVTVKANVNVEYVNVSNAINAENNTVVTVKGIVGPSLVNKSGFYLIDESGSIAVTMSNAKDLETLKVGYEVILTGTKTITKDGGGQIVIENSEILANNYGSHEYSTATFITGKTIAELKNLTDTPEETTKVYILKATIKKVEAAYYSNIFVSDGTVDILLYTSSASQYSWANDYVGKEVTIELALCDWNAKGLKGCILAIYTDDGKLINQVNFTDK